MRAKPIYEPCYQRSMEHWSQTTRVSIARDSILLNFHRGISGDFCFLFLLFKFSVNYYWGDIQPSRFRFQAVRLKVLERIVES